MLFTPQVDKKEWLSKDSPSVLRMDGNQNKIDVEF